MPIVKLHWTQRLGGWAVPHSFLICHKGLLTGCGTQMWKVLEGQDALWYEQAPQMGQMHPPTPTPSPAQHRYIWHLLSKLTMPAPQHIDTPYTPHTCHILHTHTYTPPHPTPPHKPQNHPSPQKEHFQAPLPWPQSAALILSGGELT